MRVAHEQATSTAVFQTTNMVAHARLRQAKATTSFGETAGGGNGSEGLEPNRIEHGGFLRQYGLPSNLTMTVSGVKGVPDDTGISYHVAKAADRPPPASFTYSCHHETLPSRHFYATAAEHRAAGDLAASHRPL